MDLAGKPPLEAEPALGKPKIEGHWLAEGVAESDKLLLGAVVTMRKLAGDPVQMYLPVAMEYG